MNIKRKFLQLTSRTYPHGTEKSLYDLMPDGLTKDDFGNLFIEIGDSDVMFTSHLDTATSVLSEVRHVFEGKMIKTDGKSILGADDKAGVVIMLNMIENKIPGLYYFFLGEEVGCLGSKKVAEEHIDNKLENIKKVVSFDRRGTDSVITYQSGKRCASDEFGEALAKQFNEIDDSFKYEIDPTGVLTDSVQFTKIYPECTNISVGYYSEHTHAERQDIEHLEKLANACLKVKWSELPVKRDPSKVEYRYGGAYGYGYAHAGYGTWDDYDDTDYTRQNSIARLDSVRDYTRSRNLSGRKVNFDRMKESVSVDIYLHDTKFNYVSQFTIYSNSRKYTYVDLSMDRVVMEKDIIDKLLKSLDLDYKSSSWDGFLLKVFYNDGQTSTLNRNDIIDFLPEFDYVKLGKIEDLSL